MMSHMQQAPPANKPPQQQGAPLPPQGQQGQQQAAGGEPEVIRNLMVNYIPTTIDEVQLRQLFEMYGPVESVKIVVDRDTRTSKGYGFVKFRFSFSAVHAIQYLNGYPLMNKRLKVAYSNQSEAQKMIVPPAPGAETSYPGAAYPAPGGGEDNHQAWATQMNYMQQIAALQMMHQYQQSALPTQHHAHHQHQHQHQQRHHHHHHHHGHHHHHAHQHHHHHHHHPQQPQQPQQAQDAKQ